MTRTVSAEKPVRRRSKLQCALDDLTSRGLTPTRTRIAPDGTIEFDFEPDSSAAAEGKRLQRRMEEGMGKRRS